MLRVPMVCALALAALAPAAPARADQAPSYVVPSRPGIPVMINGRNAAWAVVEGDWGLYRPGHMPVTVIGGYPVVYSRAYAPRGRYYPAYGSRPERGRYEIEPPPNRELPEPAESFSRIWSTGPQRTYTYTPPRAKEYSQQQPSYEQEPEVPATIPDPNNALPPMIIVPHIRRP
jgi:hypothetical protein